MCADERKIDSRGRPPATFFSALRTRTSRRIAPGFFVAMLDLLLLAFLAEDVLVGVFHALALVRLRRAPAADFRRHLTHLLLVYARDDDLGRLRRRDLYAIRNGVI